MLKPIIFLDSRQLEELIGSLLIIQSSSEANKIYVAVFIMFNLRNPAGMHTYTRGGRNLSTPIMFHKMLINADTAAII